MGQPDEAYNELKGQEEAYNKWQDEVEREAQGLYQEELKKAMEESEKRIAKTTIDIGTLMGRRFKIHLRVHCHRRDYLHGACSWYLGSNEY